MDLYNSQSIVLNILWGYICVLIETGVHLFFIHWTNLEVLFVLTQGFPDYGTLRVSKHVGKETVYQMCLLFSAWKFGYTVHTILRWFLSVGWVPRLRMQGATTTYTLKEWLYLTLCSSTEFIVIIFLIKIPIICDCWFYSF